jgi:hypothetical protein
MYAIHTYNKTFYQTGFKNGGRYVIRTRDPSRVKGVLYH